MKRITRDQWETMFFTTIPAITFYTVIMLLVFCVYLSLAGSILMSVFDYGVPGGSAPEGQLYLIWAWKIADPSLTWHVLTPPLTLAAYLTFAYGLRPTK